MSPKASFPRPRQELAVLEARLADVDLAARNGTAFEAGIRHYGQARELEKAENAWLALEILREELDCGGEMSDAIVSRGRR